MRTFGLIVKSSSWVPYQCSALMRKALRSFDTIETSVCLSFRYMRSYNITIPEIIYNETLRWAACFSPKMSVRKSALFSKIV